MSKHEFIWLDLETTGLDPHKEHLLEWAIVLAEDGIDGDMSPVAQFSGVIDPWATPEAFADGLQAMDPFVRDMHERNGLLSAVANEGTPIREAEDAMLEIVTELAGPEPRGLILAGSTVHFDLSFIRVHMPRFAACLSHRVFDVSTLKNADRAWLGMPFQKAEAHRALPDVLESLAHARVFRDRHVAYASAYLAANGLPS